MIERTEFRISASTLEWRSARWSFNGWKPTANSWGEIQRDCANVAQAFNAWRGSHDAHPVKRCLAVIDDCLVRYATVPSLDEARSVREYQDGARLRCETVLGWTRDKWKVQVALPPQAGAVLCCAYPTADGDDWCNGCRLAGDAAPIIVPNAIAALNHHRARLTDDALVVVVARSSCVAVLLTAGAPAAVYQTLIAPDEVWHEKDLQRWLEWSSVMDPGIERRARYVIDTREWATASRLSQSLDQVA